MGGFGFSCLARTVRCAGDLSTPSERSAAAVAGASASTTTGTAASAASDGGGSGSGRTWRPAGPLGYPAVLDALMPKVLHSCWDDGWGQKLGGAAALQLLVRKLPPDYLQQWCHQGVRALLAVAKHLPDHCIAELEVVQSATQVGGWWAAVEQLGRGRRAECCLAGLQVAAPLPPPPHPPLLSLTPQTHNQALAHPDTCPPPGACATQELVTKCFTPEALDALRALGQRLGLPEKAAASAAAATGTASQGGAPARSASVCQAASD